MMNMVKSFKIIIHSSSCNKEIIWGNIVSLINLIKILKMIWVKVIQSEPVISIEIPMHKDRGHQSKEKERSGDPKMM